MKKTLTKVLAVLMALCAFGMSACSMKEEPSSSSSSEDLWQSHGELNVWTLPATANPIQEEDCSKYYKNNPTLEISMAKNESEGAQILFHATGEVREYTLEICDLTDVNGNKIKKENISVYNTYYTHVEQLSAPTSGRPYGHYPDALIPQHLSEKVGENKVNADFNQSIFVDVFADKDTPAGIYMGNFMLKVDNENTTVPVRVQVRDFTLTDTNNVQSAFYLFPEYIMGGDLNNTPENYQKYVDYLLDYRVSTTDPVYSEITDEEEWVSQMKEYAANPKVSSYNIGNIFGMEKELRLLIENSTPELNLVEKAFRYLYDEPPASQLETIYGPGYYATVDKIIAISRSYTSDELATYGLTHEDIEGIEVLITLTMSNGKIEGLRTYCGLVNDFNSEAKREQYQEQKENPYLGANNELEGTDYGSTWWYVCCHPFEPYPNYHIDNSISDARVLSWMQYDYDIDGMLYWGTAGYFDTASMNDKVGGWVSVDPYDDAEKVFTGIATQGDGFLLYPGAKYGESGPIPSLRLMNIRDGFEDYEYLLQLETLVDRYAEEYELMEKLDFDNMMASIYNSLYDGVIASADFTRVIKAREAVMDMIEWLESDAHAIVNLGEIDILSNEITVDVYAQVGATLAVNGQNVNSVASGEGVKFTYKQKLDGLVNVFEGTLTVGDKSVQIQKPLGSAIKVVDNYNDESNLCKWQEPLRLGTTDYIDITYNTDLQYVKTGTGSMRVQIDNGEWTDWEAANFISYISLSKENFFGLDRISQIDYVEITLYNASNVEFRLDFLLQSGKNTKSFANTVVKPGWNTIKIPYINEMTWAIGEKDRLDDLSGIALGFELIDEDIDIYIDSIYYAYVE